MLTGLKNKTKESLLTLVHKESYYKILRDEIPIIVFFFTWETERNLKRHALSMKRAASF